MEQPVISSYELSVTGCREKNESFPDDDGRLYFDRLSPLTVYQTLPYKNYFITLGIKVICAESIPYVMDEELYALIEAAQGYWGRSYDYFSTVEEAVRDLAASEGVMGPLPKPVEIGVLFFGRVGEMNPRRRPRLYATEYDGDLLYSIVKTELPFSGEKQEIEAALRSTYLTNKKRAESVRKAG